VNAVKEAAVGPGKPRTTRTTQDRWRESLFVGVAAASLVVPLLIFLVVFADAFHDALPRLGWDFLVGYPSRHAEAAGILPALVGTICLMGITAALAIPIGLAAAIYLEEYAAENRLTSLIELNISTLAGVPSIIYGLLGLELFVRTLALGRSLLAGGATLALLLLPMIIITSREAIRTVPQAHREASLALGATRWQTVRNVVLPAALPGALTGIILSFARAIGETAPLITIGALTYVAFLPDSLQSAFTALPIQIFNWVSRPQVEFRANAAAGIVVLLVVMVTLNAGAIWLRIRLQSRQQGGH
jgi:phosphate transport system permease protein